MFTKYYLSLCVLNEVILLKYEMDPKWQKHHSGHFLFYMVFDQFRLFSQQVKSLHF